MITINNSNKPPKWVAYVIIILIGLLVIALIRGCKKAKNDGANIKSLVDLTDSFKVVSDCAINGWKESKKAFQDTLEFERGQRELAENKYERTALELDKALDENAKLIAKYKANKYADTSLVLAPAEFIEDCHDCFSKLEKTSNLSFGLKKDIEDWRIKYNKETSLLLSRLKQVEAERNDYYHTIDSLTDKQEKAVEKIKQKGRLYLSWGVQWKPWPSYAGAGLLYQTKRNMLYGAKWYYGTHGHMLETTINFPLSLK